MLRITDQVGGMVMGGGKQLLLLGVCVGSIGCGLDRGSVVGSAGADASARTSYSASRVALNQPGAAVKPAFDVQRIVRSIHFSFREHGGAFRSTHTTHEVTVLRDGKVLFTPQLPPVPSATSGVHPWTKPADRASSLLQLETVRISRRGMLVRHDMTSLPVPIPGGALSIARGTSIETLENGETGLEQRWRFHQRPVGDGPILVAVRVDGQDYIGKTMGGLHFRDRSGGIGVRYGLATWVDAKRKSTPLAVAFQRGEIVIEVPQDVVDNSAYPAELDPLISAEFDVDKPVLNAPAPAAQMRPSLAFDGTNYLVVWQDNRNMNYDIYGTRVTSAGQVLDSSGIAITSESHDQLTPKVAFDGTNYFVVWQDYRAPNWPQIYGSVVSPAGTVSTNIPISAASAEQGSAVVAAGSPGWLVAWQDNRKGNHDIFAARVSASGSVLDAAGLALTTDAMPQESPSVASDGTNYLVVWGDAQSQWHIRGRRVTKAGQILDSSDLQLTNGPAGEQYPSVTYGGGNFLLVWQDIRNGSAQPYDVFGTRVSSAGVALDSPEFAISTASGDQVAPNAIFAGGSYLVVWEDHRNGANYDVYAARVTSLGVVSDPQGIPVATGTYQEEAPAVATDGTAFLVAWSDGRWVANFSFNDIFGGRISATGATLDGTGLLISTTANTEQTPDVAFDGSNYLVVWSDLRSGTNWDIYGARVDPNGNLLDPNGIAISAGPKEQWTPSVAYGGSQYLVVWRDRRAGTDTDIYGARVTTAGVTLDPNGIPVSITTGEQLDPAVSYGAGKFLVVWSDRRGGSTGDIYATFVDQTGAVSNSSGLPISTAVNDQRSPAVASDGQGFWVAWKDKRNGTAYLVYGAAVDSKGSVSPSGGQYFGSASLSEQDNPTVAYGGKDYFVVVAGHLKPAYGTGWIVEGRFPQLTPGAVTLSPASAVAQRVDVTYGGGALLVTYQDLGGLAATYCRRVTWDGIYFDPPAILDTPPILIPGAGLAVSSAGGPTGQFILTYQQGQRTRARFLSWGPLGSTCATAADCSSGNCADKVCCDTACNTVSAGCQVCSKALGASQDGTCTILTGASCSDGKSCTSGDVCDVTGKCAGTAYSCTPGPCELTSTCDGNGGCNVVKKTDGTPCNTGLCLAGLCVGLDAGPSPDAKTTKDIGVVKEVGPAKEAGLTKEAGVIKEAGPNKEVGAVKEAGPREAGTREAAVNDIGTKKEAAAPDSKGDTTSPAGGGSGCGCSVASVSHPNPPALLWLLAIALAMALVRATSRRRPGAGHSG